VSDGTIAVSKVVVPLPVFPVNQVAVESDSHFLVKIEMNFERIIGSYEPKEHEAFVLVKVANGSHLNFRSSKAFCCSRPHSIFAEPLSTVKKGILHSSNFASNLFKAAILPISFWISFLV
jgi:hypothetical protein